MWFVVEARVRRRRANAEEQESKSNGYSEQSPQPSPILVVVEWLRRSFRQEGKEEAYALHIPESLLTI